jgi:Uma2 family endonuclease
MSVATPINWAAIIDIARRRKRVLLDSLNWHDYQQFLEDLGTRHLRHTYEDGRLEVMPISWEHEATLCLLRSLVVVLAEELKRPFNFGGQMTIEREDLDRGIQPDQCYWFRNLEMVIGKTEFNFAVDPPPDLFLEVEISRSLVDRLPVLATLGITEVWRYDGQRIQIGVLDAGSEYAWGRHSPTFPEVDLAELERFLAQVDKRVDHLSIITACRTWVRESVIRRS